MTKITLTTDSCIFVSCEGCDNCKADPSKQAAINGKILQDINVICEKKANQRFTGKSEFSFQSARSR